MATNAALSNSVKLENKELFMFNNNVMSNNDIVDNNF